MEAGAISGSGNTVIAMAGVVVALGAWCDLVPPELSTAGPGGVSFDVHEFAVLDDGRRLALHEERGWTSWLQSSQPARSSGRPELLDPWSYFTIEDLEQDVLNVVLPDEEGTEEKHPWEWLRGLLQKQGVEASAEHLKTVPYTVEFSDRVLLRFDVAQAKHADE